MGCGGSKVENLPLVTLCRERKDYLKAASEQRYSLAAAHLSYFQSLKEIGNSLRKFVDEETLIGAGSSSPVLTLPSDEGKIKKPVKNSSSSTSISHSVSISSEKGEISGSHLHLSSGSDSDPELDSSSGHIHIEDSPEEGGAEGPYPSYSYYPPNDWGPSGSNSYTYYMKKSATPAKTVVYEEPEKARMAAGQWPDMSYGYGYGYQGYSSYGNGGVYNYGDPMGSLPPRDYRFGPQPTPSSPDPPPPPPSPPRVSTWDFLNVFDTFGSDNYPGYYAQSRYGFGSTTSSPDSKEVREREGIPDLEDETEQEVLKEVHKAKKKLKEDKEQVRDHGLGEGTSKEAHLHSSSEGSSKTVPFLSSDSLQSHQENEIKSSPDSIVSKSSKEDYVRKKEVSFDIDEAPRMTGDAESSKPSSLATLSSNGTRDLQEVVEEIKEEFQNAFGCGKEVAVLLEVGKLPYQSRGAALKVLFSKIKYLVVPSRYPPHTPSQPTVQMPSRMMKMAKAYCGEPGKDFNVRPVNLSSTLEKLYVWEKKLYKEVKDEESLRILYEKMCKKLKMLDDRGAETSKIEATQASIRKLMTKINICIRAIESISNKIQILRDTELQPQLAELIHGLMRMWKYMLKCHQKQFQAIMESKARSFRMNAGFQRDSGLRATVELELELLHWCTRFNSWVNAQKLYVESLNEWLMRCLIPQPEETSDGVAPFSPGRIEAPPIFVICHDWYQAMARISEKGVTYAMHHFAQRLHELWERNDEAQPRRIKAEFLSKDFEKRLRTLRMEMGRANHDRDKMSNKTALSKVDSDSGVSPLDDLKVDLDMMKMKLQDERGRHKEAMKLVHDSASNSIQAGLVPIFQALENFTSEVLKAHEQVRLENFGS